MSHCPHRPRPPACRSLLVALAAAVVAAWPRAAAGRPTRPDARRADVTQARRHRAGEGRPARARRAAALAAHRRRRRRRSPCAPRSRSRSRTPARRARRPAWTRPTSSGSRSSRAASAGSSPSTSSQVPAEVGPIRSVRPMDPAIAAPAARPHRLLRRPAAVRPGAEERRPADDQHGCRCRRLLPQEGRRSRRRTTCTGRRRRSGTRPTPSHAAAPPAAVRASPRRPEQATAVVAGAPAVDRGRAALRLLAADLDVGRRRRATCLRSEGTTPAMRALGRPDRRDERRHAHGALVNSGTTDPAGNPVPETVLEGTGDAHACPAAARRSPVTWTKTATDAVLTLATADGAVATLAPGDHVGRAGPAGLGFGHDQLRRPGSRSRRAGVAAWSGAGGRRGSAMTTTTRRGARGAVAAVLAALVLARRGVQLAGRRSRSRAAGHRDAGSDDRAGQGRRTRARRAADLAADRRPGRAGRPARRSR